MTYAAYVIVRPILLPFVGFGGLYLAVDELKRSPLHHNTVIWVVGFGLAGVALFGLYREVHNRVVLLRWLGLEERAALVDQLPRVQKAVAQLPPWHRARYLAKKHQMDELPSTRTSHVGPAVQPKERGLLRRLRNSALFVMSVLLLGLVGAFAFVQWLQIVLADFGNPTPWLITWVLVATYFLTVAVALFLEVRRRSHGNAR